MPRSPVSCWIILLALTDASVPRSRSSSVICVSTNSNRASKRLILACARSLGALPSPNADSGRDQLPPDVRFAGKPAETRGSGLDHGLPNQLLTETASGEAGHREATDQNVSSPQNPCPRGPSTYGHYRVWRCGHRWVGSAGGSFGCPICGDHDGDHHMVRCEEMQSR